MVTTGLKKFIESNAMSLATVGKNGKPHAIAVAYVKVIGNQLVISNAHIKESIKNIEQNENVALAVWNKEWEKACVGYELIGKAKNHTSGKWFEFVRNLPDNKGYEINSAIVVKIKRINPNRKPSGSESPLTRKNVQRGEKQKANTTAVIAISFTLPITPLFHLESSRPHELSALDTSPDVPIHPPDELPLVQPVGHLDP